MIEIFNVTAGPSLRSGRQLVLAMILAAPAYAQQPPAMKPADTEVWTPEPKVITPGAMNSDAPSDAIVLFGGKNNTLNEWVNAKGEAAGWTLGDGLFTVNKKAGDIKTKRAFRNYQLHIEWRIPSDISGKDQARGNSGVYLGANDSTGYELQILDSYVNKTYVNGQAASIYKQSAPLVNASRRPGEWQAYDVLWTAPVFQADGSLSRPAHVTVFHNGIVVQNDFVLRGGTEYIGMPAYKAHGALPLLLQAHGDPSAPISFRNIWIRELQ